MCTDLYLDTARLGRMCRRARMAEHDFIKLVSQLRSPLYFGRFLSDGFGALGSRDRERFSGLCSWPGITGLKQKFRQAVAQPSHPVYPFAASRSLIRFAAECLFDAASSVLTTDVAWPPYLQALEDMATLQNARLHIVRIRRDILNGAATAKHVVQKVVQAYEANKCDGLFVSDISYLGARMPVRSIVNGVTQNGRPFVVVDGAQAFGQRPVNIEELNCDLYLAGVQKWVSAYHPLRLAFVGRGDSLALIRSARCRLTRSPDFHDALLDFVDEVERMEFRAFGETVNLVSLFTAAGALSRLEDAEELQRRWHNRCENAKAVAEHLSLYCQPGTSPQLDLRSGIVLVPPWLQVTTDASQALTRRSLDQHKIVATVLPDGYLRLAMPSYSLTQQHLSRINTLVQSCQGAGCH